MVLWRSTEGRRWRLMLILKMRHESVHGLCVALCGVSPSSRLVARPRGRRYHCGTKDKEAGKVAIGDYYKEQMGYSLELANIS